MSFTDRMNHMLKVAAKEDYTALLGQKFQQTFQNSIKELVSNKIAVALD